MGMAKFDPRAGKAGVQLDRAGEQPDGLLDIRLIDLLEFFRAEQIELVGIEVLGRLSVGGDASRLLDHACAAAETVRESARKSRSGWRTGPCPDGPSAPTKDVCPFSRR